VTKKLGLVLEGGGGKGAYQMGALRAFAERGLCFDCVAGTSVGGLNAALWATGKLAEGENLWFNISQDKIYPWRRPRWFRRLLMFFLVPLYVTVNYVRGSLSLPIGRNFEIAVRIVLILLVALMALVGYFAPEVLSLLCIAVAMILIAVFVFYNNQGYVGAIIGSYAGIPIFALLMLALIRVSESIRDLQARTFVLVVCLLGLPLVIPYLTRLALACVKWIGTHLLSQSFLNSLQVFCARTDFLAAKNWFA
jgi:Patatin-like phospholipase